MEKSKIWYGRIRRSRIEDMGNSTKSYEGWFRNECVVFVQNVFRALWPKTKWKTENYDRTHQRGFQQMQIRWRWVVSNDGSKEINLKLKLYIKIANGITVTFWSTNTTMRYCFHERSYRKLGRFASFLRTRYIFFLIAFDPNFSPDIREWSTWSTYILHERLNGVLKCRAVAVIVAQPLPTPAEGCVRVPITTFRSPSCYAVVVIGFSTSSLSSAC